MRVDIFVHGFSVEVPADVDPTDEQAVYQACEPLVTEWLRNNCNNVGFEFEPTPEESDES